MFLKPMSDEEISDYKEAFRFYDRENKGYFTLIDFDSATKHDSDNPTYSKLCSIIKREGYSHKFVEFPMFLYFMCQDRTEHVPCDDPREAFCMFDKDGDGLISKNDLRHGSRLLGEYLLEEELDNMMGIFTLNETNISFKMWKLMRIVRNHISVDRIGESMEDEVTDDQISKWKKIFGYFDKNGDGYITHIEVVIVMKSHGRRPHEKMLCDIIKSLNGYRSRGVDFPEFLSRMSTKRKRNHTDPEKEFKEVFDIFDMDPNSFTSLRSSATQWPNLPKNWHEEEEESD